MRPVGFEPTTPALGEPRSIQTELRAQITTKNLSSEKFATSPVNHLNQSNRP
jgi:hypothetical protein